MVSSWLVSVRRTEPVALLAPSMAYELCVVSHVYLLNGNPLSWKQSKWKKKKTQNPKKWVHYPQSKTENEEAIDLETLVLGSIGCILVHFAGESPHPPQCSPESQVLSELHVSPICDSTVVKDHTLDQETENERESERWKRWGPWLLRRRRWWRRGAGEEEEFEDHWEKGPPFLWRSVRKRKGTAKLLFEKAEEVVEVVHGLNYRGCFDVWCAAGIT